MKALIRAMSDHGDEEPNGTRKEPEDLLQNQKQKAMTPAMKDHGYEESNEARKEPEDRLQHQEQFNTTLEDDKLGMDDEIIHLSNIEILSEESEKGTQGEHIGLNSSSSRRDECKFKADHYYQTTYDYNSDWKPGDWNTNPCVAAWSKKPECGDSFVDMWAYQSGTTGKLISTNKGRQCEQGAPMNKRAKNQAFKSFVMRVENVVAAPNKLGEGDSTIVCSLSVGQKSTNRWKTVHCTATDTRRRRNWLSVCKGELDPNMVYTDWKMEISHRRRFSPWMHMDPDGKARKVSQNNPLNNIADTPDVPLKYRFMMNVKVMEKISSGMKNIALVSNAEQHEKLQEGSAEEYLGVCGCRSGDISFNGGTVCRGCSSKTFCGGYYRWKSECAGKRTKSSCEAKLGRDRYFMCKWFPEPSGECGCKSGDIPYNGGVTCRSSNSYLYWKRDCSRHTTESSCRGAWYQPDLCKWNGKYHYINNQVRLPAIYQLPGSGDNWKLLVVSSRKSHRSDGCRGTADLALQTWYQIIVEVKDGNLIVTARSPSSADHTTQCTNGNYNDPEHGGAGTRMWMSDKNSESANAYLNGFYYRVPGHNPLYEHCGCKPLVEKGIGNFLTAGSMGRCEEQFAASKLPVLGDAIGQIYNGYNVFSTCSEHCSDPALNKPAKRRKCAAEVAVTALSLIPFVGDLAAAAKCIAETIDPNLYEKECIGTSVALATSNGWASNVTVGQTLKFLQKDENADLNSASFGKPWGTEREGTVFMLAEAASLTSGLTFHTECGEVQVTEHHELLVWDQDKALFMRVEAGVVRSEAYSYLAILGPNGDLEKCSIKSVSKQQFTAYMPLVANMKDVAVGDYLLTQGRILLPTYSRTMQRISDSEAHDAFLSWVKVMPTVRAQIPCLMTSSVAMGTNTLVDMFEKFIADHEHVPGGYAVVLHEPYALICYVISHVQEHYKDDAESCPQLVDFHTKRCKGFANVPQASEKGNETEPQVTVSVEQ